jgi:hypothetical protein
MGNVSIWCISQGRGSRRRGPNSTYVMRLASELNMIAGSLTTETRG